MPFVVQPRSPLEQMQMVKAARLHYLEGATKSVIADRLDISRFKVARLLSAAVTEGVVDIRIQPPSDIDVESSDLLAGTFDLADVIVVRLAADADLTERRRQLGEACAAILADLLREDDVVGIAWGRTLHAMVNWLPPLPRCTVVQLVGSIPSSDLSVNSLDLARTVAARAGGDIHPLHVPMVLENPDTAAQLRTEPSVRTTTALFRELSHAVVGIGSIGTGQSSLLRALPESLRAELVAAGGAADICAAAFAENGDEVGSELLGAHCVAIGAADLRTAGQVTAVAGGAGRAPSIAAALRSGLIHRLITDDRTAVEILELTRG